MNILEWKCHELYVSSKYQTLKDELLLNQVCTIEMFQWELVLQKTKYHLKTEHFKSLYADTQNYISDATHFADHPVHFGYREGESIGINHLICLQVYCNYDTLQSKFSETYRRNNDGETLTSIIQRH
eukprot:22068_1